MKENDDYIFINVVFSNHEDRWKLGKQLALKYTFVFNPQTKAVGFYKKSATDDEGDKEQDGKTDGKDGDNEGGSNALVIILIIVLCLVVIAVVIFVVIFCKKKNESSTELKDSQYYDGKDSKIVP